MIGSSLAFFVSSALLSGQDSLSVCHVNNNGTFKDCQYLSDQKIFNPSGLSFSNNRLFISNYGMPHAMGTSYIQNCSVNLDESITCQPFFGLAINENITAIKVMDKKVFFIESYFYHINGINYLVACDLPSDNSYLQNCGIPKSLKANLEQTSYNVSMDIAVHNSSIFVTDRSAGTFFTCTYPDADNAMTCSEKSATAENKQTELIDTQNDTMCRVLSNKETNTLQCCNLAKEQCSSISLEGKPMSLSVDESHNFVYLSGGVGQNTFSVCHLNQGNEVVNNCTSFTPVYKDPSAMPPSVVNKIVLTP